MTKQREYVCSKCKNEDIGTKEVYENENDDKEQSGSQLYPYKCALLNDSEL